jgi:hypothetical protein
MYFPLRKYMTGPRAASLPGQRPREPAVTRQWNPSALPAAWSRSHAEGVPDLR